MKKYIYLIFILVIAITTACGPKIPHPGEIELNGHLDMKIYDETGIMLDRVSGIFKVDGPKNQLSMFLDNRAGIPIGHVVVRDGDISGEGLSFVEEFSEIFKFWPYIFGIGADEIPGKYSYRDIEIEYIDGYQKGGGEYAKTVNLKMPDGIIKLDIKYEN